MPIHPLPPETVRLLGSSVAISTPAALVKELIDNAIDARATSVEVLISPNTVDRIQVRDNGSGIALEDLDFLGRRAHTSKLRSFEELNRGVGTLGFRGEALASANCLASNGLTVTTRPKREPVATRVKLKPAVGGVQGRCPTSAPPGTTVSAEGLFGNIPVRRQQAVKECRTTLAKVRDLMLAYVLARPRLKASLRVVGEPGQGWMYAPSTSSTTGDVILKAFGKYVAAQSFPVDYEKSVNGGPQAVAHVTMECILPTRTCSTEVMRGKGSFISVDSRPITSTRGTGRKITRVFRSHLNRARAGSSKISNPLMCLSIQCSPGLYDANVAPLKDEVLFVDEKSILDCFEELCRRAYTAPGANTDSQAESESVDIIPTEQPRQNIHYSCPNSREPGADDMGIEDSTELQHLMPGQGTSEICRLDMAPDNGNCTPETRSGTQLTSKEGRRNRYAMMRTRTRVDMSRDLSSLTDEDTLVDSVAIEVPLATTTIGQEKSTPNPPGPVKRVPDAKRKGDIRQFFPSGNLPHFQIATNDTATEERTPMEQQEYTENTSTMERTPLRQIQEWLVSERADAGTEGGRASPRGMPLVAGNRRGEGQQSRGRFRVQAPGSASSRGSSPARNPMEAGDLAPPTETEVGISRSIALRTPPLSNLRRPDRAQHQPYKSPVRRPRNGATEYGNGRGHVKPVPKTMGRGWVSLEPRLGRLDNVRHAPAKHSKQTSGGVMASAPAPTTSFPNSPYDFLVAHGGGGFCRSEEPEATYGTVGEDVMGPHGHGASPTTMLGGHLDPPKQEGMWSHALQVQLMRTPSPGPDSSAAEKDWQMQFGSSVGNRLQDRRGAGAGPGPGPGPGPADVCGEGKQSEEDARAPQRARSEEPFPGTRTSTTGVHNLRTTLAVSTSKVSADMDRLECLGGWWFPEGQGRCSLAFDRMRDVNEVDERLQATVGGWATEGNGAVEVDWVFRSRAKGKQRA